ncbi:MAG: DUF2004 domain-containing protein [Chitinophagales bacterium]|nr:DUF2004 domain-containing protein [Chitinophagales bacterium]
MTEFSLPYFGQLFSDRLEEYYCVEVDFNGREIQLDLNFEQDTLDLETINMLKQFIEDIEKLDKSNEQYLLNDYYDESGETVKFYLEHHLNNIPEEQLSTLINFKDQSVEPILQLLSKLNLVRVGLYPNDEENFAVFDYSIGKDFTNYLVVINLNVQKEVDYITMES